MKLHFSPAFDGEHYVDYDSRGVIFDEKVVGELGLLSELERRLGILGEYKSDILRLIAYYRVLKSYVELNGSSFIASSFGLDPLGVSSRLLSWRDELVMAGWSAEIGGNTDKLKLLSELEAEFCKVENYGFADRWRAIEGKVAGVEIELHIAQEYLHPAYNKLSFRQEKALEAIAQKETNLHKIQQLLLGGEKQSLNADDNSFEILHFKDYLTALEYVASQKDTTSVYICQDSKSYDALQQSFGLPSSGSEAKSANPQPLQLFKLGILLHTKPLNIYNLISYLQIETHPIPSDIRYSLINSLTKNEGVNDDFTCDGQYKIFLPTEADEEIKTETIKEYCSALGVWAKAQNEVVLCEMCDALIEILSSYPSVLSTQELRSLVLAIYSPVNYTISTPKKDSAMVISSASAMVDTTDNIVYLDCQNAEPKSVMYNDISSVEAEWLESNGVKLWSRESQIRMTLNSYKLSVLKARKKVTLIYCDEVMGVQTSQHPLLTELFVRDDKIKSLIKDNPNPNNLVDIEIFEPKAAGEEYIFPEKHLSRAVHRVKESYSSMSMLQDYPINYVFNYMAKINSNELNTVYNIDRVMGNVAHSYIEDLLKFAATDRYDIHTKEFAERIDKKIKTQGAVLLLTENISETDIFKRRLYISVSNLLAILLAQNLVVVGCEVEREYRYTDFIIGAKMDLLLKDESGDYVIFDLKWASHKATYWRYIEENKALQLEVYRNVLQNAEPNKKVVWVGYYLLKHGSLFTTHKGDNNAMEYMFSVVRKNEDDIYEELLLNYNATFEQFKASVIPVDTAPDEYGNYKIFKESLK